MVNFLKESSLSPLRIMLFLRLAENRLVLREMREPGGTGPVRQREMNRTNPFNHKELEYLLDFYKSTNSRPGCSATAFIVNATGRVKEWGRPGQCPTSRWGRLLSPVREAETEKTRETQQTHTGSSCTNGIRTNPTFVLLLLLTLVQSVHSDDVVPAHLLGCAEFHVGVGDGLHRGAAVHREAVPKIM